jgi:hypothetical protein
LRLFRLAFIAFLAQAAAQTDWTWRHPLPQSHHL